MEIIKTFGNYVEKWCENTPDRARWLLTKGWEAQDLKFRLAPSKKINPSDQYLARMMMNASAVETSGSVSTGQRIYAV